MKPFEYEIQEFLDELLCFVSIDLHNLGVQTREEIDAVVDHHYWEMHTVQYLFESAA